MKRLSFPLLVCLTLATLVAVPAVLAADGVKFYVDGRCAVGARPTADGTLNNPVCVGRPPDYSKVPGLPSDGTIVYIYEGGYCEIPVVGNNRGDATCQSGTPQTGTPVASVVIWGLVGIIAVVLLVSGMLLRRRASA